MLSGFLVSMGPRVDIIRILGPRHIERVILHQQIVGTLITASCVVMRT